MPNFIMLSNGEAPKVLIVDTPIEIPKFIKGKFEIIKDPPPYLFLITLPETDPNHVKYYNSLIYTPEGQIAMLPVEKTRVGYGIMQGLHVISAKNDINYLIEVAQLADNLELKKINIT